MTVLDSTELCRMEEIRHEMKGLVNEWERLVRGTHIEERAKGYIINHIRPCLDSDHGVMSRSTFTMEECEEDLSHCEMWEEAGE